MKENKRTNEPVFWVLFGAGGTMGAICAPALILVLLLFPALGLTGGSLLWQCLGGILGRLFLFVFISLTAWCGMHRMVHTLHDLKVHSPLVHLVCYGGALTITALSLVFALVR